MRRERSSAGAAWHAFRHHLFILISLLGCLAPALTPRIFPVLRLAPRGELVRQDRVFSPGGVVQGEE